MLSEPFVLESYSLTKHPTHFTDLVSGTKHIDIVVDTEFMQDYIHYILYTNYTMLCDQQTGYYNDFKFYLYGLNSLNVLTHITTYYDDQGYPMFGEESIWEIVKKNHYNNPRIAENKIHTDFVVPDFYETYPEKILRPINIHRFKNAF